MCFPGVGGFFFVTVIFFNAAANAGKFDQMAGTLNEGVALPLFKMYQGASEAATAPPAATAAAATAAAASASQPKFVYVSCFFFIFFIYLSMDAGPLCTWAGHGLPYCLLACLLAWRPC